MLLHGSRDAGRGIVGILGKKALCEQYWGVPESRMCQRHGRPESPLLSGRSRFIALTPLDIRVIPHKLPGSGAESPRICHHPIVRIRS
jgi:hypothetical protein